MEYYSIVCSDFGLCSDLKWRHKGFNCIGKFSKVEAAELLKRWRNLGIDTKNIKIEKVC